MQILIALLNHPFRVTIFMLLVLIGLVVAWLVYAVAWWVPMAWLIGLLLYLNASVWWLMSADD